MTEKSKRGYFARLHEAKKAGAVACRLVGHEIEWAPVKKRSDMEIGLCSRCRAMAPEYRFLKKG